MGFQSCFSLKSSLTLFTVFLLAGCAGSEHRADPQIPAEAAAVNLVPKEVFRQASAATFEVIVPKSEDAGIQYEQALPLDKLSYQERTDHYIGIGTAFGIGKNRFISAAHVFSFHTKRLWENYYLRDNSGQVYKIAKILKYSSYRDVVEMSLEKEDLNFQPLAVATKSEIADSIYVVGNALGAGLSFRAGQISSYTSEERDNQWKFIRFSAPASPGNSGGPLLNEKGEVIGVVVRKSPSENLNYALPIEELDRLAKDKAEFSFPNMVVARDRVKTGFDMSFKIALPNSPAHVASLAFKTFSRLFQEAATPLYDLEDERFFPASPKFQEYVQRQQDSNSEVNFVSAGSDGSWSNHGMTPTLSYEHGKVSAEKFHSGQDTVFILNTPEGMALKDFVKAPQLVMEAMLREIIYSRKMGNVSIRMKSFGPPSSQEEWSDELGRPWWTAYWNLHSMNSTEAMDCSPLPKGMACHLSSLSFVNSALAFPLVKKVDYSQLLIQYKASVSQWQEFLALEARYRPSFLQTAQLNWQNKKELQFKTSRENLLLRDSGVSAQAEIIVRPHYASVKNLAMEVSDLQVHLDGSDERYFRVGSVWAPLKNSTEHQQQRWQHALERRGDFDEKIHFKENKQRVFLTEKKRGGTGKLDRLYFVSCSALKGVTEKIQEDCQGFRDLSL